MRNACCSWGGITRSYAPAVLQMAWQLLLPQHDSAKGFLKPTDLQWASLWRVWNIHTVDPSLTLNPPQISIQRRFVLIIERAQRFICCHTGMNHWYSLTHQTKHPLIHWFYIYQHYLKNVDLFTLQSYLSVLLQYDPVMKKKSKHKLLKVVKSIRFAVRRSC